jgi:HEAT repeat protein
MLSTRAFAPSPSAELEASADGALRHFGTNAVPTLLRMLRARDSVLTLKLLELARKQHLIRIKHTDAAHLNTLACRALERLTELARSVLPALIEVYDRDLAVLSRTSGHDSSAEVGVLEIPRILGKVGPEVRIAIPSLLRGATNTVPNVRWIALAGLGEIHLEPETVVPVLTQALQDPDPFVKSEAARALAKFGQDAQPWIPALVELLKDSDHWSRDAGLRALGALHLNAEVAVPALITALESTNHHFAFDVALTLQTYGAAARPAIPALIEYFGREENPNLRGTIRRVMDQIDPEAAAKAGIK